jgi:CDP-diacylglycerol--glycerol-3-phosphate 3-phosphatidyltransferase
LSVISLPNLLTLFRLFSAPVFLVLFIGSGKDGFLASMISPRDGLLACLIVMSLSEISDVLDGILARKLNQVSDFGKLLDPYADSTFRLSCFFAFASRAHGPWIPLWMVMTLFYRDLLVTVIRTFGVERRVFVHARASGKIKAVAQGTVVFVILSAALVFEEPRGRQFTALASTLMWVVTAVTAWSAWDYFWSNRHLFSAAAKSSSTDTTSPPNP